MSVSGWTYSPLWTGQRGGDWTEPLRRKVEWPEKGASGHLDWPEKGANRLLDWPEKGAKREVDWPGGLKREVDWHNPLKRGVDWPFSNDVEDYWPKRSKGGRRRTQSKTFTSKAGGQKYVTDQVRGIMQC